MKTLNILPIFLCFYTHIMPVQQVSFTSVGSLDGGRIFHCNTNVSLVCQSERRPVYIAMRIDDELAVVCLKFCQNNTAILGNYTAFYDFDIALIIIHINKTSITDENREFKCEDGISWKTIKPIVKVFPEASSTHMEIQESDTTNSVEVKVTTGCVLLSSNVTFVWNKTRTSNGSPFEPLLDEEVVQTNAAENSNCIPSHHCGGSGLSSTIKFNEAHGGMEYFITCTIYVPEESIPEKYQRNFTIISNRSFKLKGMVDPQASADKKDNTTAIVLPATLVPLAVILIIVVIIWYKRR